jgi:predicted secreted Zn-dependent protease
VTRRFAICSVLLAVLAVPPSASASSPHAVATGSAAGTVTAMSGASFTIQTTGPRDGVVNALTATANYVTKRN